MRRKNYISIVIISVRTGGNAPVDKAAIVITAVTGIFILGIVAIILKKYPLKRKETQ